MTPASWIYLFFVVLVVIAMVKKHGVGLITTLGIFVIGFHYTGNLVGALQTVFRAYFNAGTSLFDLILMIAVMGGMLKGHEKYWSRLPYGIPHQGCVEKSNGFIFCSRICDVRVLTFLLANSGNSFGRSSFNPGGSAFRIAFDGSSYDC